MNKKFLTPRNPDLFPLVARRINMLHPALVGTGVNTVPHPHGVFLEDSGDYVADWIPGGSESSPNDYCTLGGLIQAPDGTLTGRKIVEGATTQEHSMVSGFLLRSGVLPYVYRFRKHVFVKAAERTRVVLSLTDTIFTRYLSGGGQFPAFDMISGVRAVFDLAGGTVAVANVAFGTGFEALPASITPFKRGWYRCTIECLVGALYKNDGLAISGLAGPINSYLYLDAGSGGAAANTNYAGNGTSGVYVWKGCCLPSAAFDLDEQVFYDDFLDYSTIDTLDSQEPGFNWYVNKARAFADVSAISRVGVDYSVSDSELHFHKAADGTNSHFFSVVSDGTASGYIGTTFQMPFLVEGRVRSDTQPPFPTPGVTYGYSYWTSAADGLFAPIGNPTWPLTETVEYDWVEPGDIGGFSTPAETFLPKAGAHDFIPGGPSDHKAILQNVPAYPYTNKPDFTDQHNFAFLSFPQAAGTPPFSVGQRNVLSNTAWADAVVGTPGTLPGHMSIAGFAALGISVDVVSITAGKLQLRFHGTVVGDANCFLNFNSGSYSSAAGTIAPGQVWCGSIETRIVAGADTGFRPAWITEEYDSGNSPITSGTTGLSLGLGFSGDGMPSVLTRVSVTRRLIAAGAARLRWGMFWLLSNGQVIDATYEFYRPQLERSFMPTAFQASSGSDPAVVNGVTMTDAERFQQRHFLFFDGSHIADFVTSSHTNLRVFPVFDQFIAGDTLNFPLIFNVTQAGWPSHWDWMRVIK